MRSDRREEQNGQQRPRQRMNTKTKKEKKNNDIKQFRKQPQTEGTIEADQHVTANT